MSQFEAQTRAPTRLTYRAIGSGNGQEEFLGSHVDFGAGDIPIPKEDYEQTIVHIPFALSSVSFFYRIDGVGTVNLDGCTLAKILNREITHWNHKTIVDANPELKDKNLEITVCHRVHKSSSTKSITKFLNIKCPFEWTDDQVGSEIEWKEGTTAAEGSAGMAECVKNTDGAIGYMESGHGWDLGLSEVSLRNKENVYITSKEASDLHGITEAANLATTPPHAGDDWSDVHFIDQRGKNTFPIVLMSYIYVRRELEEYILDHNNRALLQMFLKALYMDEYFGECSKLGFNKVPTNIEAMAMAVIDPKTNEEIDTGIKWAWPVINGVSESEWKFESTIDPVVGAGEKVISSKRKSYQGVALEDVFAVEKLTDEEIENIVAILEMEFERLASNSHQQGQINSALVLAALSFTLWCCVIVGWIVKRFVLNI